MNARTQQSITLVCVGAFLSVQAAFVAAGLTGCALAILESGLSAPEMFGWAGFFILIGLNVLIMVAPALMAILACGVRWRTPLRRHAWWSMALPSFLGVFATVRSVLINVEELWVSGILSAGTPCLAITIVAEILMKRKLQHQAEYPVAANREDAACRIP